MIEAMLKNIRVSADCDFLKVKTEFSARKAVVFTGSIDEYFGFDLGRLDYRSQRRTEEFWPDVAWVQPCAQINNPNVADGSHIRSVEWKHLLTAAESAAIRGSLVTRETPYAARFPDECEYPFPDSANTRLYMSYRERALAIPSLLVCGRLGEYRYYDMDQAIARARLLAGRLLSADRFSPTLEDQMVFTGGHVP
jgi:UDP-galactopyranose mutase